MNSKATIIMYHYVRDLKHSRYPDIKGLDVRLFKEQINFLRKNYNIITMEILIDSINNNESLPKKSVLLTFDDAYSDHFEYVFPILDENKIQGSFYPPAKTIIENKILDVNKIHFILASENDKAKIINEIKTELNKFRKDYNLPSFTDYYKKLAVPNRFDTADVIFIKRILQVELDESLRNKITDKVFRKFVGIDERSFSKELYMKTDQLKCMARNGMHIGSHGYDHYWLSSIDKSSQRIEIIKSLDFLKKIGVDTKKWTMCFPYGDYNETTLQLLKENKCSLGLTTEVNIADFKKNNKFTLPRLDTNDLPKDRNSNTNKWYLNA